MKEWRRECKLFDVKVVAQVKKSDGSIKETNEKIRTVIPAAQCLSQKLSTGFTNLRSFQVAMDLD